MLADVRFGSLANVAILNSNVCFIPDSGHPADAVGMSAKCHTDSHTPAKALLFDHLVGAQQERVRHFQAEQLGRGQVNDEVKFRGLLDGQIGWFRST